MGNYIIAEDWEDECCWSSIEIIRPSTLPPPPSLRETLIAAGAIVPLAERWAKRPTLRLDERGHYFAVAHTARFLDWCAAHPHDEFQPWRQDGLTMQVGRGIEQTVDE